MPTRPARTSPSRVLTWLVGLVALVLLAAVAPPSYADTEGKRDLDDVDGRLDLARVSHTHVHGRLVHTITMQEGWRARVLRKGELTMFFKSGSRYRTVDLRYRRHRLVGRICRDERLEGGDLVNCSREVGLARPDGRSVAVTLWKKQVRKEGRQGYKWQVTTFLDGGEGECPRRRVCVDALPGEVPWLRHGLGED